MLPILGTAAFAAFTSPPFGGYPSQTSPMVWQCYSGLIERTAAVCQPSATHPTNIIPSRTHWGLLEAKALTRTIITNAWWMHTAWGVTSTNRLTEANICPLANVGADFWTNTPPAGMSTATNGWNGLMRVITNLKWTAAQGVVENCGGRSNVIASAACETGFAFTASAAGFPLYEARNTANAPPSYQGYYVQDCWFVGPPDFGPDVLITTNYPPPGMVAEPPGTCFTITNGWAGCSLPVDGPDGESYWNTNWVPTVGTSNSSLIYTRFFLTNTITDACHPNYLCDSSASAICSHLAPITFDNCTNRYGTNVVADIEQWFNIGSTGTCAGAVGLTDPFGYGMAVGWTNLFANTTTIGLADSLCNTNFAGTNRVPWIGSTTSTAWAVYDAVLVKKWRFDF